MEQNKKRLADYQYKSGMGRSMGQNTKNGILNFHSTEKKELTINTGFYG
jgi:hypothetical protein